MKLYKYSAVDENCLSGLINSQLWFSDPRSFNDPFDVDLDNYYKDRLVEVDEKLIEINALITKTPTVLLLNQYRREILKLKQKTIEDAINPYEKLGFLCLTKNKGESNTLMWSHYGNSHEGVMLEFSTDKDTTFFKGLIPIEYDDKNLEDIEKRLKSIDHENYNERIMEVFCVIAIKATQWKYEQEIRLFKIDIKNNQRLFKYDPNCLTGIYFGLKTTEEHKQTIKQIIQLKSLKNTKLYQAEKVENSSNLVYTEICD